MSWPVYTGSNHDAGRLATRWAGGDPDKARVALMMLLTLRGTPFLYYGDEIGLTDSGSTPPTRSIPCHAAPATRSATATPAGRRTGATSRGRLHRGRRRAVAAVRRPATNVAAQRDDPGSTLHLTRDLIALRREAPDLRAGLRVAALARGRVGVPARDGHAVALNLSGAEATVEGLEGRSRSPRTARATARRAAAR